MTKPEIAKAILERRNRMTHVILPGEINAAIGPDGVLEALSLRWLVPDLDTGFLCASNDLGVIEEMRKLAEMKPEQYSEPPLPILDSRDMTMTHALRQHALNEIAAPMTGGSSPGISAISQPTAPQPPQRPTGQSNNVLPIGSAATVARNGIRSVGVIQKILPDGRYKMGFTGQQQRPPGDDVYGQDEMSVVPENPQRSPVTAP